MGGYPYFRDFGHDFPRLCQFWPKTKVVRMVHTNNFYEMGLEISDPKDELWTQTEVLEGWGVPKFSFGVQGGLVRVSTRPKMIFKILRRHRAPSQPKFHIFHMVSNENRRFSGGKKNDKKQ